MQFGQEQNTKRHTLQQLQDQGLVWFAGDRVANQAFNNNVENTSQGQRARQITQQEQATRQDQKITTKTSSSASIGSTPFGIPEIDQLLPFHGLRFGALHEFYTPTEDTSPGLPYPPFSLLAILIGNAVKQIIRRYSLTNRYAYQAAINAKNYEAYINESFFNQWIVWIGKPCWPTPSLIHTAINCPINQIVPQEWITETISTSDTEQNLTQKDLSKKINFFKHCLFLNPPNEKTHQWCIETVLASPATAVLITDLKKISFATSRRLALLAKQSGALALFLRPQKALFTPTLTMTTWGLRPHISESLYPCWQLELIKCKGALPKTKKWLIECENDDETLSLRLLSSMVDQHCSEATKKTGTTGSAETTRTASNLHYP